MLFEQLRAGAYFKEDLINERHHIFLNDITKVVDSGGKCDTDGKANIGLDCALQEQSTCN